MRFGAACAAVLALFAAACAGKPPAPPVAAASRADKAYAEAAASLKEENYDHAIDRLGAAWKENPAHPGVARDFPEAIAALKKSGDEAYRQGRLEDAGRRWASALRATAHPAVKGAAAPVDRTELRGCIDRLTASLLEKALADYRAGRLESAIASWRIVLAYDPANQEAAKSSRTAATQLENLKKITAPR